MSYYITIDSTSRITGLYTNEPGYPDLPSNPILISDTDAETLKAGFTEFAYVNNAVVSSPLSAEAKTYSYVEDRAAAYPPIQDYIDGIVKGDTAQVQTYINACLAVKAKYPKPKQPPRRLK